MIYTIKRSMYGRMIALSNTEIPREAIDIDDFLFDNAKTTKNNSTPSTESALYLKRKRCVI